MCKEYINLLIPQFPDKEKTPIQKPKVSTLRGKKHKGIGYQSFLLIIVAIFIYLLAKLAFKDVVTESTGKALQQSQPKGKLTINSTAEEIKSSSEKEFIDFVNELSESIKQTPPQSLQSK